MTRDYRLLVLDRQGTPVREFVIPRLVLWIGAASLAVACFAIAGLGTAIGRYLVPIASPAHERGPALTQAFEQKVTSALLVPEPVKEPCGPNMILVEGDYCPVVLQRCQRHTDPEGSALRGHRCAEYKQPATCLSPQKQHLRFCVDRDEYVVQGEALPQGKQTFADARKTCDGAGKRLCSNVEWTFACEGERMNAYPYGFVRDSSACNADRSDLVTPSGDLKDMRVAPGTFPRCSSAFGVRDLTGNLEEFAVDQATGKPVRKGGYWQPGENHCRLTVPHVEADYRSIELGFRCCADAT